MELTFEEWCEVNEDQLTIIFAETGADREMDFDREAEELARFDLYIKGYKMNEKDS